MAGWTLIGSNTSAVGTTPNSLAVTVPGGGVPAGSLIVVFATQDGTGTLSIADNASPTPNTWVAKSGGTVTQGAFTMKAASFYTFNSKALAAGNAITVGSTVGAGNFNAAAYYRTDGLTGSDPFDIFVSAPGTSTSPSSGTTGTLNHASEAAICCVAAERTTNTAFTFSAGSGWSAITAIADPDATFGIYTLLAPEWQDVSATTALTGNGTLSASVGWIAMTLTFQTATPPTAPTIGTATAGNTQATVTWTAPGSSGSSSLASYTIKAYTSGPTYSGISAVITAPATSGAITGLTNGTAYTFTVLATNTQGASGPESAQSNSVTPITIPDPPTGVSAIGGWQSAVVSWTAPGSNGGSAITNYTITGVPAGSLTVGNVTSATVSGLAQGSYSFTVYATNAAGNGAASSATLAVLITGPSTITLAVGRRAPRFKLNFYSVLTGANTPQKLGGIDLNADLESLSFTRQSDGGDCALMAGYAKTYQFPNELQPRHFGSLQRGADTPHFAHVVLTEGEGKVPVWQGRMMLPERPGGRFAAFQAQGYAYTALNDNPFISADKTVATSGAILRSALSQSAPIVGIAEEAWTDPGVPHAYNSFGGYSTPGGTAVSMRYPRELLTQILSEGTQSGLPLRAQVVRQQNGRMLLGLIPVVAPAQPDYRIDFTDAVAWKEDLSQTYGGVYVLHSGGTKQPTFVSNPLFSGSYSGLSRTAYINGGNLDDTGAAAFGQNWLTQKSVPAVACTFTVGGMAAGEVEGLRLYGGGTRAPWLVKDGEWVQVGDLDAFQIVRTSFDANSLQLTVSLGQQDFGWERTVQLLRQSAAQYAQGNSPVTGARAF